MLQQVLTHFVAFSWQLGSLLRQRSGEKGVRVRERRTGEEGERLVGWYRSGD